MLILVAVTVSYGIKSGLLSKAKEGGVKQELEQERETLTAAVAAAYDVPTETIGKNALEKELGNDWTVVEEGTSYTVTSPKKNKFTVDANGKVTLLGNSTPGSVDWLVIYDEYEDHGSRYLNTYLIYDGHLDKLVINQGDEVIASVCTCNWEAFEEEQLKKEYFIETGEKETVKFSEVSEIIMLDESSLDSVELGGDSSGYPVCRPLNCETIIFLDSVTSLPRDEYQRNEFFEKFVCTNFC